MLIIKNATVYTGAFLLLPGSLVKKITRKREKNDRFMK
jgi:hypothetical protein